jgi:hypothetical protein
VSEITAWEQSAGALVRNGGYFVSDEMLAKAQNLESEKRWLHADWEARMDAADAAAAANAAAKGQDAPRTWRQIQADQRTLVERGWAGAWVEIPGPLTAPELAPLSIAAAAGRTREAVFIPAAGGGDRPANEEAVRLTRESVAKMAAAQEALDRMNAHRPDDGRHYPGNILRTVG